MDGVDKPKLLILVRQPLVIALKEFTRLQDQLVRRQYWPSVPCRSSPSCWPARLPPHCERYAGRWKPPVANCHEAAATPKPSC